MKYVCVMRIHIYYYSKNLGLNDAAGNHSWERIDDLNGPRSDHACAVVQHFYGKQSKASPPWTTGIMVAGGYRLRGAWISSVEFLDFRTGKTYHIGYKNNLSGY